MKEFLAYTILPAFVISLVIVLVWYSGTINDLEQSVANNDKLIKIVSELEDNVRKVEDENKALRQSTRVKNLGTFRISYYCNDCPKFCGTNNVTSEGDKLTAKMQSIAVDPEIIPQGTIVVINGKLYLANDKGGAINGRDIDIMVYGVSHQKVLEMGIDYLTVWAVN